MSGAIGCVRTDRRCACWITAVIGAAIVAGLSKEVLARGVVLSFEGYPGKLDFHPPRRGISSEGITKSADRFASATAVILPDGRRVTFVVGV